MHNVEIEYFEKLDSFYLDIDGIRERVPPDNL